MTLREWLAQATHGASDRTMARKVNAHNGTLGNAINRGDLGTLVQLSRAYGLNPVDGLLAVGALVDADLAEWGRQTATGIPELLVYRLDPPAPRFASLAEYDAHWHRERGQ